MICLIDLKLLLTTIPQNSISSVPFQVYHYVYLIQTLPQRCLGQTLAFGSELEVGKRHCAENTSLQFKTWNSSLWNNRDFCNRLFFFWFLKQLVGDWRSTWMKISKWMVLQESGRIFCFGKDWIAAIFVETKYPASNILFSILEMECDG